MNRSWHVLALGICLLFPPWSSAQQGWWAIRTVAGNGQEGFAGDGGAAIDALLDSPEGVAVGASGNVYLADTDNHRVRRIDGSGTITTFAGNGTAGFSGDGGQATVAMLNRPTGVAVDAAGRVYIADSNNNRIRRVGTDGVISTFAGTGGGGYSEDGGPATAAQLMNPYGVAVAPDGRVYIADDGNNRVRRVANDGTISTVAGSGTPGFSGDGGPATAASLNHVTGVAVDAEGILYIVDYFNQRVRRVAIDGTITTFAGSGTELAVAVGDYIPGPDELVGGYSGDGGPATSARLNHPNGVAVDSQGNVYIAEHGNARIRRVDPTGVITTFAGGNGYGTSGDGGRAVDAGLHGPQGVAVLGDTLVYIADQFGHRIRQVYLRPTQYAQAPTPDFDGLETPNDVTFDDFFMLAEAMGRAVGDGNWDPRYDLDGNGSIGYGDFFIFFDNFGRPANECVVPIPPGPGPGPYGNASAVFSLTTPAVMTNVGPDSTVQVALYGQALAGVKQVEVTLEYAPANAFDAANCSFGVPTDTPGTPQWIVGGVDVPTQGRVTAGAVSYMPSGPALNGMQPLASFSLRTSGSLTPGTEVVIRVVRVAVGSSSVQTDVFDEADLGLTVRLNPLLTVARNRRPAVFPNEPYPIQAWSPPAAPPLSWVMAYVRFDTVATAMDSVVLRDDGQAPDMQAGDRRFAGVWLDDRPTGRYVVDLRSVDQDAVPHSVSAAASFLVGHTIASFPDTMLASPEELANTRVPVLIEDDGSGYLSGKKFKSAAFGVHVIGDLPAGSSMAADTAGAVLSGLPGTLASAASWVDDGMWQGWELSASLMSPSDSLQLPGGPGPVQRALVYVDVDLRPASHPSLWFQVADLSFDGQRQGIAVTGDGQLRFGRGDVDTSATIDGFDASLVLMHTVHKVDLDQPNDPANDPVEAQYDFTLLDGAAVKADVTGQMGVSALDAALILQRDVGIITHFPTENWAYRLWEPPSGWNNPAPGYGKPVAALPGPPQRVVALGEGRLEPDGTQVVPVCVDPLEGILAGTLTLRFDPAAAQMLGVRTTDLTTGYQVMHHVEGDLVRVSFAGVAAPTGSGPLVEFLFRSRSGGAGAVAGVQLVEVQLNEETGPPAAEGIVLPQAVALSPNYPNPFNPSTTIAYALPRPGEVSLEVYNLVGQRVRCLATGLQPAGFYRLTWDGRDEQGDEVASGVYLCRLTAQGTALVRKMVLVK